MSKELSDRIALVTGGSRGIGRAICLSLARKGAYVIVNYSSSAQSAEETLKLCKELGGNGEIVKFSVAESDQVNSAFDEIKAKHGKLDILVNNAGIAKDGLILRMKDDDWHSTINTNLAGAFYCARAAAKLLLKSKSGRVVNISSVVGEMGNAGQVPYVSSKAGMIGMTKSLARELASRLVTVNAVTPGFIETEMTESLSSELKAEHLKAIPLGQYGKAEDIAEVVAFLCTDSAKYITGQVIGVNGGMYM